jgi:hypothetical protein
MAGPPGTTEKETLRPAQSAGGASQSGKISSFQGGKGFFSGWFFPICYTRTDLAREN